MWLWSWKLKILLDDSAICQTIEPKTSISFCLIINGSIIYVIGIGNTLCKNKEICEGAKDT